MGTRQIHRAAIIPQSFTHGKQLTVPMTGPWSMQNVDPGDEVLTQLTSTQIAERISTFSGRGLPSWIPNRTYVHDGDLTNHGGIVGAGGLNLFGFTIPQNTWVARYFDMSEDQLIFEGDAGGLGSSLAGVLFLGCTWRNNWASPGAINYNAIANNTKNWLVNCDGGGLGATASTICESIFESQGNGANDRQFIINTYLSYATTLAFGRNSGDAFVRVFGEKVPRYFNDDTYHLNGLSNSGGQAATLWSLCNLDFNPQPDAPGNTLFKAQNDCIQMAADGGAYPGTGINLDGSQGYQILNNYLAGADHILQLGVDKSNTSADVSNVSVQGNLMSTKYFTNGGQTAVSYKNPSWGVQGNDWGSISPNLWDDDFGTGTWDPSTLNSSRQYPLGDGPRTGQLIVAGS